MILVLRFWFEVARLGLWLYLWGIRHLPVLDPVVERNPRKSWDTAGRQATDVQPYRAPMSDEDYWQQSGRRHAVRRHR